MEGVDVSGQLKRRRWGKGSWQKTLHYNCISHCQDKRKKKKRRRDHKDQVDANWNTTPLFYPIVRFSHSYLLIVILNYYSPCFIHFILNKNEMTISYVIIL